MLLAVDDAHQLDMGSLALLINAASSNQATVCLTARTAEPMTVDLVDLWTNGVIERIDLQPLNRAGSRSLTHSVMGDIDPELDEELWRLAAGNPLLLHELIEGSVGQTIERDDRGVWRRRGELTESARLSDLVTSRLMSLPEHLQSSMDIVAVGAPLPTRLLREVIGDDITELEARRLVSTVELGGSTMAVVGHPLYGEILQVNLGGLRRQNAYLALVEGSLTAEGAIDSLRAAVWQRDCGAVISPDLAVRGALGALVRHDPALAEELVRPLGVEDDLVALVLGRALSYQQRFVEAEDVLRGREPADPQLLGEIASVRAQNLAFGLGKVAEARDLLDSAARGVEDDELRARMHNERAMISAIRGDFGDARRATEEILSDPASGDPVRAAAYVTLTVAQAMTGDVDGLNAIIDDAIGRARTVLEDLPFALDQIQIMEMQSLLNEGRIADAVELARTAVETEGQGVAMKATWLSAFGLALDLGGRLRQAVEVGKAALAVYAEVTRLVSRPRPGVCWPSHMVRWEATKRIRPSGGSNSLSRRLVWRYGWIAAERGLRLRGARWKTGFESWSPVGARLMDMGAPLLAAEAWAQAAALLEPAGHSVSAARATALSMAAEQRCEHPSTPALRGRPSMVSEREMEVALDAVDGRTSPQIALDRFISVRTVDNHLRSAYRKMDVDGREGLRQVMEPILPAS